jgi:hypothetical protein
MLTNAEKTKALHEWIKEFDPFASLNSISNTRGASALVQTSAIVLKEYIGGAKLKNYLASIMIMTDYSVGTDAINQAALDDAGAWTSFIDGKIAERDFPEWGEVDFVEFETSEMPSLLVDPDGKLAKYTLTLSINYRE